MRFGFYDLKNRPPSPVSPTEAELQALALALKARLANPEYVRGREGADDDGELYQDFKGRRALPPFANTEEGFDKWASEALSRFP